MTDQSLPIGDSWLHGAAMAGLAAYAGCWVALIGDQVAGIGHTPEAARLAARRNRPRERIGQVCYVQPAFTEQQGDLCG